MKNIERTMRIGFVVCLAAFLMLTGAIGVGPACGQQAGVKIGVICPTRTVLGSMARTGSEVAAEMINASGGLLGKPVQLIIYDDNYNPAEGVVAARRLLNNDKVSIIVGTNITSVGLAILKVAQENNGIYVAAMTKAAGITEYDKGFRLNPLPDADIGYSAAYLKEKIQPQRVAIVAENADYGRLAMDLIKKAFADKVVATELYELMKQTDFSTLATRVKASNPDLTCMAFAGMEQAGKFCER